MQHVQIFLDRDNMTKEHEKHYCECPLHEEIIYKESYEKYGYPKFIKGHSSRCMTQDTKNKLKEARSKQIPPMLGKKNPNFSKFMKEHNPMYNPEVVAKHSGENNWMTTPEGRLWASERIKGDKNPSKRYEVCNKISEANKEVWKNNSEKRQEKSELLKKSWQDPKFKIEHLGKNHYRYNGGIEEYRRRKLIRRSQLGWYSLNPIIGDGNYNIRGYQRYHVNQNDIIYVPIDYNQDIPHNVVTGYNMTIINHIAYLFLIMNNISELNKLFNKQETHI